MEHIVVSIFDASDLAALETEDEHGFCNGNCDTSAVFICW